MDDSGLKKELIERVAKFLGYESTQGISMYEMSLLDRIVEDGLADFDAKVNESVTCNSEIKPDGRKDRQSD